MAVASTVSYCYAFAMPGRIYMTLLDVAKHYGQRAQQVVPAKAVGTVEEWVPAFDANVQNQLPQLLDVMTADVVVP